MEEGQPVWVIGCPYASAAAVERLRPRCRTIMEETLMIFRRLIPLLLFFPAISPAVSKEMQELMRDVALLQQQVKDLQQSQDSKLTELRIMLQQTLDASNRATSAVAGLEGSLRVTMQQQLTGVVSSSAGVGSRVEAMGGDIQALRAAVEDITGRMGKLQQQLTDLNKAVQAMQAPPAPPPAAPSAPGAPLSSSAGSPPPNLPPATVLYENARRDHGGGKLDLALQEFYDYLKYYGNTDMAPNAQFYIGNIHFAQGDYESAIADFDAVLEKYPDNSKTPDALLMKGRTLVKMGRPTQGAAEFRELVKRFPNTDQSTQAKAQLKALGLSYSSGPAGTRRKR
jgi:tol-pal system protein YbgF